MANYRATNRAAILSTIFSIVAVVALEIVASANYLTHQGIFWFRVFLITALISILVFNAVYSKRYHKKVSDIMDEQCDAQAYIQFMLKNMCGTDATKPFNLLNLARGYQCYGDFDSAERTLLEAWPYISDGGKLVKIYEIYFYMQYSSVFLCRGQLNKAKKAIELLREIYQNEKLSVTQRDSALLFIVGAEFDLLAEQGNYAAAREYCAILYRTETRMLGKVASGISLGRACLGMGDIAAAIEPLRFAAANGGTTRFAREAAALLAELEPA